MKKALWIEVIVMLGVVHVARPVFARDKVECLWPDKPVVIDGLATEWSDLPVVEMAGIAFRAMNDSSNLYFLIRGANSDGRVVLSGRYGQDLTLWFLKSDHKARDWGINLDFGRAHPPEKTEDRGQGHCIPTPTVATFGVTPEKVLAEGLEVSTASLPAEMEFASDLSTQNGRQPIYEIRIPLQMLERSGNSIYVDFVTSEVSPEARAELMGGKGNPSATSVGDGSSGGHHKRGGKGGSKGPALPLSAPRPMTLHLTIALTKEPIH